MVIVTSLTESILIFIKLITQKEESQHHVSDVINDEGEVNEFFYIDTTDKKPVIEA